MPRLMGAGPSGNSITGLIVPIGGGGTELGRGGTTGGTVGGGLLLLLLLFSLAFVLFGGATGVGGGL